ncbi:hypothetical protein AeMF1_002594 [Aphanomyces euteiches]|nr:hypothetical protein AeMF1_002594 [Aphanomyces euteiches]
MKESLENLVVAAQNISQKAREAQTGASAMLVELATWTDRDEPLPPDTLTAFETWVRTSLTVKNTQATVLWLIEAYRVTQVDSVELPLPQFLSPSRAITMGEATTTNHTETAGVSTAPGERISKRIMKVNNEFKASKQLRTVNFLEIIDATGVARLDHVELDQAVKTAYIKARDLKPWQKWLENFQSFLPGRTDQERAWITTVLGALWKDSLGSILLDWNRIV